MPTIKEVNSKYRLQASEKPSGEGWEKVGDHGGMRRPKEGGGYEYWYPSDDHAADAAEHHGGSWNEEDREKHKGAKEFLKSSRRKSRDSHPLHSKEWFNHHLSMSPTAAEGGSGILSGRTTKNPSEASVEDWHDKTKIKTVSQMDSGSGRVEIKNKKGAKFFHSPHGTYRFHNGSLNYTPHPASFVDDGKHPKADYAAKKATGNRAKKLKGKFDSLESGHAAMQQHSDETMNSMVENAKSDPPDWFLKTYKKL